jgi:hypothetical protein
MTPTTRSHAQYGDQPHLPGQVFLFEKRVFQNIQGHVRPVLSGHHSYHPFPHVQGPLLQVFAVEALGGPNGQGVGFVIQQPEGADLGPHHLGGDYNDQAQDILQVLIRGDGLADQRQGLDGFFV